MNGTVLKLIAAFTMLIDHLGILLLSKGLISMPVYYVMRMVGRMSFPIFAFLIVQGFIHTKSFWKYLIRISVFAILAEIPYNLFLCGNLLYFDKNNILFTFILGLLVLYTISKFVNMGVKGMYASFVVVTVAMVASYMLNFDYSWCGILLIVFMYLSGTDNVMFYVISTIILILNGHDFIQLTAPLALVLIHFYNGKRGKNTKYLFYVFYPGHLLVLWMISYFI